MRKGFNAKTETEHIINKVREYFDCNSSEGRIAVLGISGGKDSTIAGKVLVKALGSDNVYGVLMPNGEQKDIDDSYRVSEMLGIEYEVLDIKDSYDGILSNIKKSKRAAHINKVTTTNIPPRIRTAMLYAVASTFEGGRVICTSNASEQFVGYSTKWGDGAGDFAPLIQYTVSEIIAIGRELGIPEELIIKAPADGLTGFTDEEQLGFTYDEVETVMENGHINDKPIKTAKILIAHAAGKHKTRSLNLPSIKPLFLGGQA